MGNRSMQHRRWLVAQPPGASDPALLLAAAVSLALLSFRRPLSDVSRTHESVVIKEPMQSIVS